MHPSTHFIAAHCRSQSTYSEYAWLTTVQAAAAFGFVMWGEIKHQLGAWTEEGYDGRAGNAAYIAYIKFRTRPTRWDLSSASTVLSQQPQTNILILNYDTLEPQHNAEVGHMSGCCRNWVLCWQTRIAGLSNVQGHLCFALFWFPLFFPRFYFFRIFLVLLPPFSPTCLLSPVFHLSFPVVLIRIL